jgi:hypothetical protein
LKGRPLAGDNGWYRQFSISKTTMSKPFHLMTPAERTAARIAENRAIDEKIAEAKTKKPPVTSTESHVRMTPEDRAKKLGSLIRKVSS